jgi:hypothetical protein
LVKPNNVDRPTVWDCKNIKGSQSLHLVASISHRDVILIKLPKIACFYFECMDDNVEFCQTKLHVEP